MSFTKDIIRMQSQFTSHSICYHIHSKRMLNKHNNKMVGPHNNGAFVPIGNFYQGKTQQSSWIIGLGQESNGEYNPFCGSGKSSECVHIGQDGNPFPCYLQIAYREAKEEGKIHKIGSQNWSTFDKFVNSLTNKYGRVRYLAIPTSTGFTPVFIGVMANGFKRAEFKGPIKSARDDHKLPHSLREMIDYDQFYLEGYYKGIEIDGKKCKLTQFAENIINTIDVSKL